MTTTADKTHAVRLDLEELASRGFGHQDAQTITGRMRVALDQIDAAAGDPPPPADPVQDQLSRLNLAVAALAEAVGPVLKRQTDVAAEINIMSGQVSRLTELLQTRSAGGITSADLAGADLAGAEKT